MSDRTPSGCRESIVRVLDKSLAVTEELQQTLNQERAALKDRDAMMLHDIAVKKREQVDALQALDHERGDISSRFGFSPTVAGMDELTHWCDRDSVIGNRWSALINVSQRCSDMNVTNGAVIHVRRAHVDSALALIRGETASCPTYGPEKFAGRQSENRTLAQA